jgi:hypothetical protein
MVGWGVMSGVGDLTEEYTASEKAQARIDNYKSKSRNAFIVILERVSYGQSFVMC